MRPINVLALAFGIAFAVPASSVALASSPDVPTTSTISNAAPYELLSVSAAQQAAIQQGEPAALMDAPLFIDEVQADRGWFYAGGGVFLTRPSFQNNIAFTVIDNGRVLAVEEFSYDTAAAPLAYIGFEGPSGWGVRMRWYEYDHNAEFIRFVHPGTVAGPTPIGILFPQAFGVSLTGGANVGQNLIFRNSIDLDMMDFEVTRTFGLGAWDGRISLGARNAYLAQDYRGYVGASVGGGGGGVVVVVLGPPDFYLRSQSVFTGAGPTMAFELRRQLGDSLLFFYLEGRFSLLWGETDLNVTRVQSQGGAVVSREFASRSASSELTMGDLEVGVEARGGLGDVILLLQAGLLGQFIGDAGNAIAPSGSRIDFGGLALRAGIEF